MAAAGKQKKIPMGYPTHSTKPKTTLYLNLRTLRESKNRFRFVTSGTPRSQKQLSVSISGYSTNQNADSVLLPRTFHEAENNLLSQSPDTPRNQKRISISIPRHYAKRKTNLDFDFRVLRKQKMNCDFASLSVRSRQNEFRFCFPECL